MPTQSLAPSPPPSHARYLLHKVAKAYGMNKGELQSLRQSTATFSGMVASFLKVVVHLDPVMSTQNEAQFLRASHWVPVGSLNSISLDMTTRGASICPPAVL